MNPMEPMTEKGKTNPPISKSHAPIGQETDKFFYCIKMPLDGAR